MIIIHNLHTHIYSRLLDNISNKHSVTTDLKLSLLKPARKQRAENRAYIAVSFSILAFKYMGFSPLGLYVGTYTYIYGVYVLCCEVMFFRLNHNVRCCVLLCISFGKYKHRQAGGTAEQYADEIYFGIRRRQDEQ